MNSLSDSGNELGFDSDCHDWDEDRPWLNRAKNYSPGITGLHEEMEDFYDLMKHTPEEHEQRLRALRQVQRIASGHWPNAIVEPYGSFRTGLYLPTSDVDCVITVKDLPEFQVLTTLRTALISTGAAQSATLIENTRVPVLKFVDKVTSIMVDIVAHRHQGVETAGLVQEWCKESAIIPKLFLVLKQFLHFHRIGNVYTGGLSSYSLIIMIVCFLRHKSKSIVPSTKRGKRKSKRKGKHNTNNVFTNSGEALIEFLEFYGQEFDYTKLAIKIRSDASPFVPKEALPNLTDDKETALLIIEDPLDESNNISRGTFRAAVVQEAFASAANKLKYPIRLFRTFFPDAGFLGRIVGVSGEVMEWRTRILRIHSLGEDLSPASSEFSNQDHTGDHAAYKASCTNGSPSFPSPSINFEWMRLFSGKGDTS